MRSLKLHRDPAPSRYAYRMQRLWLTPWVRPMLFWGLPMLLLIVPLAVWFSDVERRDQLWDTAAEVRRQIEERPEFMVQVMSILGASEEVDADLRDVLPFDFPVSSFDLDLGAIRARAEEIDAVAEADVRVRAGGILEITVTERMPAAVWRGRHGLELVDENGHRVSSLALRSQRPDLPLLAGEGAEEAVPEALELFAVAGPIETRVRGLLRVGERRWDVVLDRGQRVLLPEEGARAALERVIALDQVRSLLARDLTVVDMRNADRPTLRMGRSAAERLQELKTAEDQSL